MSEYTKPSLRISATYPATDGSAPESVEVEYGSALPPMGDVLDLIHALAEVPRRRYDVRVEHDGRPLVDLTKRNIRTEGNPS